LAVIAANVTTGTREPMQRLHEVFDQRRTVGGDEAQQSLHIEAVDGRSTER
jgi:hypothetical protein